MAKQKRTDPLVWGIILVLVGLTILLSNLGTSIWDSVARLWPLVLIVWGIWKLYYGIKEQNEKPENIQDLK
ncbi:MAG: DUF5668 domain-containing protein [Acidobacteriota bacterium]|nr:DUF5668 domain-containing protein [Acidobacteriota bacterium]